MIFVDTGYFVALTKSRDELHDRAVAWSRVVAEPMLVTEYVLLETVNLLSAAVDRSKVPALVRDVQTSDDYELVPASRDLFDRGMDLFGRRPDKAWSLTDCISFLLMEERGIRAALAYDLHFEQAGFDALLRRDPPT